MTRTAFLPALAAFALVATSAMAQDDCNAENWQGCKGKPWVDGDTMDTPLGAKWWPHPLWGEGDQAGSTNWYTKPEVVQRGLAEADKGKTYQLAHPYTADMPLFGTRKFVLRIPGAPTGGPLGGNAVVWNDEFLATEIGQVGTQFDGLGHIGVAIDPTDKGEMRWYNGFTLADISDPTGLKQLGVEHLHPIVARGILIDLAGQRGGSWSKGECASLDDVNAALDRQGMGGFEFMPGDAILFRYGWEEHWGDPVTYNDGEPGLCLDVARWVATEVQAGVTGGDTWAATDPVPYPDEPGCVFCIHQYLQTRHGIVNQENLALKQLADDGVYVFSYIYSPVPIAGATGSTGSPIAID